MSAPTILCIDDDALLLDYLVLQLETIMPPGTVILKAGDGAAGLALARSQTPDLAILDLGLPDMDGFAVAAALAGICRSCRVLLVSGNLTEAACSRLAGSNVQGCLQKKSAEGAQLRRALTELAEGRTFFPPEVMATVAGARRQPDHFTKILSGREVELLPFFGYGWPNERIAQHLGISPATVRTHHQNILVKLELHGREELMRWAIKKGFADFRYEPARPAADALQRLAETVRSALRRIT